VVVDDLFRLAIDWEVQPAQPVDMAAVAAHQGT
jgi:hypothetical protein